MRMWLKAVTVIPRLDAAAWAELDWVSRWLIATRAAVLVMTAVAAGIGGLLAWRDGAWDGPLFLGCLLGLLLAHATNNLLNDLIDHARGLDRGNYFRTQYGPQPVEHGLMSSRQLLVWALVTGGLATAIGLALWGARGGLVGPLLGIGLFFVIFYTWPLKGIGLGEGAVLAVWGPLMVGGTYYVVAGAWSWPVCVASLPFALGATTVLMGKHIDKLEGDRDRGVRTLPVLLGERASRAAVLGMVVLQYGLPVGLVWSGHFSPALLLVLGGLSAVPRVWSAYRAPRPAERPEEVPAHVWPLYYSAYAFWHNRRYGLLLLVGMAIDAVITRSAVP